MHETKESKAIAAQHAKMLEDAKGPVAIISNGYQQKATVTAAIKRLRSVSADEREARRRGGKKKEKRGRGEKRGESFY